MSPELLTVMYNIQGRVGQVILSQWDNTSKFLHIDGVDYLIDPKCQELAVVGQFYTALNNSSLVLI